MLSTSTQMSHESAANVVKAIWRKFSSIFFFLTSRINLCSQYSSSLWERVSIGVTTVFANGTHAVLLLYSKPNVHNILHCKPLL